VINQEIIRKRLNKLDVYLDILHHLQRYPFVEFIDDPEKYSSTECFLHLAIEGITDIGSHIIRCLPVYCKKLKQRQLNWRLPAIQQDIGGGAFGVDSQSPELA
jgi:hypothetical protein